MSFSITNAVVQAFDDSVHHLTQQMKSRLMGTCRAEYGVVGYSFRFERLGKSTMIEHVRHGDTEYGNAAHSNRTAAIKFFNAAELIDRPDKARTIINLENAYAKSLVAAYNRKYDEIFVSNCLRPTTKTAVTGTTNGGLDFDTVRLVKEQADSAEWPEMDRYFGYSAAGLRTLLNDPELTSADYNVVKALVSGTLDPNMEWMGFKWRRIADEFLTERTLSGSAVATETVWAWHYDGCGMAHASEFGGLTTRVSELPTKQYSIQVYVETSMGGQVIDDDMVIPVNLDF